MEALLRLAPAGTPRLEEVRFDLPTFGFALAASLAAVLLFGLAPAWQARRVSLADSAKDSRGSSGASSRGRRLLVGAEVALALVLLVGAGLLLKSLGRLLTVPAGFNPDNVLTLSVSLTMKGYAEPQRQIAFVNRALAEVAALPGVVAVGASHSMPPVYIQRGAGFEIEGRTPVPGDTPSALLIPATPDYLSALGIPLVRGRFFTAEDSPAAPAVAVVNERLARRYFPDEDPLGRRIQLDGAWRTLVGIVGDTKFQGLAADPNRQLYLPYAQSPFPGLYFVVRTASDPRPLAAAVGAAFARIDPGISPTRVRTMEEVVWASLAEPRAQSLLLAAFAALALFLAALGIYGVMAYSVARRTREFGIRMALGAARGDVLRFVLRQGLALVGVGLAVGLAGSLLLTRYLSSLLFEVEPTDPVTLVLVVALFTGAALLACWLPARRATESDPVAALRAE
jgi:putative ABC transport system permease protein